MAESSQEAAPNKISEAETIFRKVSPDELLFDESNPRFGGSMSGVDQPTIQGFLFNEPNYASELVDSLVSNGFIQYEPLIVKRSAEGYVVIEGNRRLAAVREIRAKLEKYKKPADFLSEIPVLIFPSSEDEATRVETRVYLGVRHLVGFRDWPSFSKAQFLDNESRLEGGLDKVLREVQLTKQKARRFLIPYRLLQSAHVSLGEDDFWMLAEALQREGVKKFIQLDVDSKELNVRGYDRAKLKLILDDLYGPKASPRGPRKTSDRRVTDTRNLSAYSTVLMSAKATKVLHSGKTLDEASIYVDTREQSIAKLGKAARSLGILIKNVVSSRPKQDEQNLLQAFRALEVVVKEFIRSHV